MSDRIEEPQGVATENNAASSMLKEAMSSPKSWADNATAINSKHNNNLPEVELSGFGMIIAAGHVDKEDLKDMVEAAIDRMDNRIEEIMKRIHDAKPTPLLPFEKLPKTLPPKVGEEFHGGGVFTISHQNPDRRESLPEDLRERFKDAKPTSGVSSEEGNQLEGQAHTTGVSAGSEGSLGYGEKFTIKPENQVTPEMIERFKKAEPIDMPTVTLEQLRNAPSVQGKLETAKKP